jgi:hypothetical protein
MLNTANPVKFAKDCIYQLEIWQLRKKAGEISEIIKAESDSMDTVLHYTKELAGITRKIDALQREMKNI